MDALRDESVSSSSFILETDVPGLSVLPAGERCEEVAELLSSRRMNEVVEELSAEPARIVIFDSSPLLATPESQALALSMSQVLVVVKAGATERRALEAALSLIDHPSRPTSLVLNQSRRGHGDLYAGYYGVYGGGKDSGETQN
jgi:receptor protein-tyrosine kinase